MNRRARRVAGVIVGVTVLVAGVAYAASTTLTSKKLTVLTAPAPSGTTTAANVMTLRIGNVSGGTAGRAEKGDVVEVTYNPAISTSSFCSGWNGQINGSDQVKVTVVDGGAANDSLTLQAIGSATCANAFSFGSVSLGHTGYVSGGNVDFQGGGNDKSTIDWNATSRKLTVTLGGVLSTTNGGGNGSRGTVAATNVPAPVVAVYTPSTNLRDVNGAQPTGVGTTAATNGTVQF